MMHIVLVSGCLLCALQAVRAKRLLSSALWLAGVSVLLSTLLYVLDAPEVAVIELSVGAGLVTVLFVFAIAIAGDDAIAAHSVVPSLLGLVLVLGLMALMAGLLLPTAEAAQPIDEPSFATVLWQTRGLDVLVQVALIFAGVLGVLGLLAERAAPVEKEARVKIKEAADTRRVDKPQSGEVRA
jgi:uncharacterized MnhB-related membrane protein